MVFEKRHRLKKMLGPMVRDYIMHDSAYALVRFNEDGKFLSEKRIPREHVRNSKDRVLYFISKDWSAQTDVRPIRKYTGMSREREMILCFEAESVGMDTYSIASYTSALNWCELDGKMSLFHKNNMNHSIFPSFALLFPRKPSGDKEKTAIKNTIEGAKGAKNAGRILALFANKAEQLPKIESLPTHQNDKLFGQTDERIDAQVCKAHTIDPLLMGIRVSGKMGSGTDIEKSYTIFEKNTVLPLREVGEEIFNTILSVAGLPAKFKINEYQIINDTVVEVDEKSSEVNDALNSLSPLVATKVLERMTDDEIRALAALPPKLKTAV
jgi:hypothetical protein